MQLELADVDQEQPQPTLAAQIVRLQGQRTSKTCDGLPRDLLAHPGLPQAGPHPGVLWEQLGQPLPSRKGQHPLLLGHGDDVLPSWSNAGVPRDDLPHLPIAAIQIAEGIRGHAEVQPRGEIIGLRHKGRLYNCAVVIARGMRFFAHKLGSLVACQRKLLAHM